MGSRGQVKIEETGVYLYTHWGAYELEETVKASLASERGQRRRADAEYLARIIFEDMIAAAGAQGQETGFGIGTSQHLDIEMLVIVGPDSMQVLGLDELRGRKG